MSRSSRKGAPAISIFKNVLRRFGSGGGTGDAVHLAAFGKHPGWDDHIPDLGLDTPALVDLRRALYRDGIGGNIDNGAWDELGPRGLPALGHDFTVWTGGTWIMGRLWSSSDGKRRVQYPMVVCVQSQAGPDAECALAIGAEIDVLERECVGTERPDAVVAAVDQARARIRERLQRAPATALRDSAGFLAARPEFGEGAEGLVRLMYHVERNLASFRTVGTRGGTRAGNRGDERAHHLRVPRCADSASEGARIWEMFLRHRVAQSVPCWAIAPNQGDWVDLLVGEPGAREFFCLKAPPAEIPLTSDVPYQIDPEIQARLRGEIEASIRAAQSIG